MATNDAILSFDGSSTTVVSGTGLLADDQFAVDGGNATLTELDFTAAADLWVSAKAVLSCSFAAGADDQSVVELWCFEQNIDGANDMAEPTSTSEEGARLIGAFKVSDATSVQQYDAIPISLWGIKQAKFTIRNRGGQSMGSAFTVKIEGFTAVPRPM